MPHDTHLASEFYVLSSLSRLGIESSLTLGNKKKVDIMVINSKNEVLTIDVKGVAGKMDWLISNKEPDKSKNHYYLLLSFENKIDNLKSVPACWIIPATELVPPLITVAGNDKTRYIKRSYITANCDYYKDRWDFFK